MADEEILDPEGNMPFLLDQTVESDTKRTYVLYVLDKSGSMLSVRKQTIEGINQHLRGIRAGAAMGGVTRVCLTVFSNPDEIADVRWDADPDSVADITPKEYSPDGSTALYDAVGHALDRAASLPDARGKQTSFLAVIVSDGEENASVVFSAAAIRRRVTALQETGRWEFVYIGANQDLSEVQDRIGVANVTGFASSAAGTGAVYAASAQGVRQYLTSRSQGMANSGGTMNEVTQSTYNATMGEADPPPDADWALGASWPGVDPGKPVTVAQAQDAANAKARKRTPRGKR